MCANDRLLFMVGTTRRILFSGALGNGSANFSSAPVQVLLPGGAPLTGVTEITVGFHNTCALLNNGSVYCWGQNALGQLGIGNTTNQLTAVPVPSLTSVISISAGKYASGALNSQAHMCAVKSNGQTLCWGGNGDGQSGDGIGGNTILTPTPIVGSLVTSATSSGNFHSCDTYCGEVYCWGYNLYGQVGNPAASHPQLLPMKVLNFP